MISILVFIFVMIVIFITPIFISMSLACFLHKVSYRSYSILRLRNPICWIFPHTYHLRGVCAFPCKLCTFWIAPFCIFLPPSKNCNFPLEPNSNVQLKCVKKQKQLQYLNKTMVLCCNLPKTVACVFGSKPSPIFWGRVKVKSPNPWAFRIAIGQCSFSMEETILPVSLGFHRRFANQVFFCGGTRCPWKCL